MKRLALALSLGIATAVSSPAFAACDDPIKVGWEPWPPFQIPTESGAPNGIDPDILREIGARTGCEITFHETPWKRHLRMVANGDLHIAPAANKTAERDAYAKWTVSYMPYEAILWTDAEASSSFDSLKAYLDAGHSVGIIRGITLGEKMDALLAQPEYADQVRENKSTKINIRMIAAGRLDGLVDNATTTGYIAKQENLRDEIKPSELVVQSDDIHFMFSDTATPQETIDLFDEAIREMKADGTIQKIVGEYTN